MTPMFQMIVYLKERGMQDSQRYLKFLILLVSSIETATEIRIALLWRNHYLKINFHDTKVWLFHSLLIRHSKQWTVVNRKWQSKNSVWFVWLRTNIVIHTFWKSTNESSIIKWRQKSNFPASDWQFNFYNRHFDWLHFDTN